MKLKEIHSEIIAKEIIQEEDQLWEKNIEALPISFKVKDLIIKRKYLSEVAEEIVISQEQLREVFKVDGTKGTANKPYDTIKVGAFDRPASFYISEKFLICFSYFERQPGLYGFYIQGVSEIIED